MDLALEFGMPAEQLARVMTERELGWWTRRANTQWLPLKRIEWYLARIAQAIAVTMGGARDATTEEFMLDLTAPAPGAGELDDIRDAFGFNPIGKRKKK